MSIPNNVIKTAIQEIRKADKKYVGLIIWRTAKENCGYPTTSPQFEAYKRELAQLIGRRGGNKNTKQIRQNRAQQMELKGVK